MKILRNTLLAFLMCFASMAALADAVDINSADANTLSRVLKGVGPDKASAIIAYRKEHGPFKNVDQLAEVKGIGKKLLERNRDQITIGQADTNNQ